MGRRWWRRTGYWIPQRFCCTAVGGLLSNSINLISFLRSNCWASLFLFQLLPRHLYLYLSDFPGNLHKTVCGRITYQMSSRSRSRSSQPPGTGKLLWEWQLLVHTSCHRSSGRTFDSQISDYGLKWTEPFGFLASAQSWPIDQPKPRLTFHLCCQLLLFSWFLCGASSFFHISIFNWDCGSSWYPVLVRPLWHCRIVALLHCEVWNVLSALGHILLTGAHLTACWPQVLSLILAVLSSNMCPTNVPLFHRRRRQRILINRLVSQRCLLRLHF